MGSAINWLKALSLIVTFVLAGNAYSYVIDDDVPDVTGRVARISYLSGDAQIRRSGAKDWEVAVLNLPVVEGDEIATSSGARLEIQFDIRTFVRMEQNAVLRVSTYKDEGLALSVPEGTVSVRITDFERDRTYLEIDIPNSTLAVQRAGLYRIDAGDKSSVEARIRVTDGGEARVYSDTSGFTLKNGRSATVYLSGQMAGEWNILDASQFSDEFDRWTLDRDAVVAKRVKDAFFDKYYDRDIYGAEDLSSYGEWVYTRSYGYVWRPYRSATSSYADWSPYRYGHWRWVPPYGWTWINDEPWGWSTYHYGRWVWGDGYWSWTPYGYYRYRRSWWQPALVVINIIRNNVCWYPLPYHHRYRNYSRNYGNGSWGGNGGGGGGNNGPRTNPSPTPTPNVGPTTAQLRESRRQEMHTPTLMRDVPPGGVVSVSMEEFGKGRTGIRRPSVDVAKTVLSKDTENGPAILLPPIETVKPRISKEIVAETPPIIAQQRTVRTGAAERKTGESLDEELKRTRILGDRTPIIVQPPVVEPGIKTAPTEQKETRRTGAVNRPQVMPKTDAPETQSPPFNPGPQTEQKRSEPPRVDQRKYEEPREEPRMQTPRRVETPKYEPPPTRSEPPPRREEPKYEPPQKREEPRSEPPRRQDPPPSKPAPPSMPANKDGGKKDGR